MKNLNHMTVVLPEATVVALARHARPGEPLVDVIGRLVCPQDKVDAPMPLPVQRTQGRYTVSVLGHEQPCATLSDALTCALTALADLDDTFLHKLSKGAGRTRPYVTTSRDRVHPGRSDLNKQYTRELWPGAGWWISTNSSKADVTRILSASCDVAGLKFGRDVVFS
ncbi:hypothetical protein RPE78_06810 [Thioclava litoralis]|uniref:Uncharacterized protein n=1 Tax=Thioclava litoralis TaxID=3076557 RepID=A0ABZ1E1N8_9RHOB|nr:hypothetical protein RPE78_06810 [Thioclava sp. FTW29]